MRVLLVKSLLLLTAFTVCYMAAFTVLVKVRRNGIPAIHHVNEALHWKGGGTWQKFQEFDPGRRWDVVVVGSSHAYRGYDPAIFARHGLRMFNLGTSAQTPINSLDIIREYLHADNTGLLILDVFETPLRNDGMEGIADLTQNVSSGRVALRQALALRDPRAINMLTLRWMTWSDPPLYLDEDYVGAGYSRRTDEVAEPIIHVNPGTFDPVPAQLRALRRIIALCRERGIPLVLANHPMPHQADHAAHALFVGMMDGLIGPDGPPFINMATGHDLDDMRHFYDHNHLNQAGVDRYVPRLIERLEALGMLPGRPL